MESSLTEDCNEEQDYSHLPAGQTKLFLLIFGFLDSFCLFEIFALLFFSSQILSLSVAIHMSDTNSIINMTAQSMGEQPALLNWAVSLLLFWSEMNPKTTFKSPFPSESLNPYKYNWTEMSCSANLPLLEWRIRAVVTASAAQTVWSKPVLHVLPQSCLLSLCTAKVLL